VEGFRLSQQQEQLWEVEQQQRGGLKPFRSSCRVHIKGALECRLLRRAAEAVVRRHEILRTTYEYLPAMTLPVQVVNEEEAASSFISWQEYDLSEQEEAEQERVVEAISKEQQEVGYDYERGPLLQLCLVKLKREEHELWLSLPALCADARSLRNLVAELRRCYEAITQGAQLHDEPLQYADFAGWQSDLLEAAETEAGQTYWNKVREKLGAATRLTHLESIGGPSGPSANGVEFEPRSLALAYEAGSAQGLARVARAQQCTMAELLLSCWVALLRRVSGQSAVVLGVQCEGRKHERLQGALGLFARQLPLQLECSGEERFGELLQQVREQREELEKWQEYYRRDEGEASYWAVCFAYEEQGEQASAAGGWEVQTAVSWPERFGVQLRSWGNGQQLSSALDYDGAVYERGAVAWLGEEFERLVGSVVRAADARVNELEIVSEVEQRLLREWNATAVRYEGEELCLHELVEAQVERTPAAVAVVYEQEQLSYGELNERANQLAHYLQREGVGPESLVGILMERSVELVVTLLAVLKAGAAYVPLDPGYPGERLSFMIADAGVELLLTQGELAERVRVDAAVPVLNVERQWAQVAEQAKQNPESGVRAENLAYVIYTSGSSGRPKGVMIAHRSIVNRLLWMQHSLPLQARDRVLQKTPFSFDASVWELFVPLLSGAQLWLARPGGERDTSYLVQAIREGEISIVQMVPSLLRVWLQEREVEQCRSLRRVYCGGEELTAELRERFFASGLGAELHNLYGPTEVSIDATQRECERSEGGHGRVPIGRAIGKLQVYVLDEWGHEAGIGVQGELYIGGAGLARGYQGRGALTAERFVPDGVSGKRGARLYRTGDQGRYRRDGELEYLGRADGQVKVRGNRIELAEIEAALVSHAGVLEAAVTVSADELGSKSLVAYVVPRHPTLPDVIGKQLYRLPNNLPIHHLNKNETDLIYEEIFEDEIYLKYGVTLNDGDCVFDVGANIGLFTLFVCRRAQNVQVYAFEPIPPTYETLQANVKLHGLNVKLFECGLSDASKTATFNYYPKASAMSGVYSDRDEDERVTRTFLSNQEPNISTFADELLEGRFNHETYRCRLKTLSEVISENNLEAIDLLKIDVEKSELDVLMGIQQSDWKKIRQIVLEVHDLEGRLEQITLLLKEHGFNVTVDQDALLANTGLYNLYAINASQVDQETRRSAGVANKLSSPPADQVILSISDLRNFIRDKLPEYMMPSHFVMLETLPRMPNGKLDRNALPAPDYTRPEGEQDFVAPRTPVEELLADIWAQVLNIEPVGVHDNFFDRGGHSLLATQLVSRVRETFHVELPLRALFSAPTVAGLAQSIEALERKTQHLTAPPMKRVSRNTEPPLSMAQQRLWFSNQLEPDSPIYNLPTAVRLEGTLNVAAFRKSLNEVIRRHEALRTKFAEIDGQPVQIIAPALTLSLPEIDLRRLPHVEREREVSRLVAEEAQRPFDLTHGPLLRAGLLQLDAEDHVVLFTAHHAVSDGWSTGVLTREISILYESFSHGQPSPLPELALQYADFAIWQREWLQGEALDSLRDYWLDQLAGVSEVISLPTDRPRPTAQSYRGALYPFRLTSDFITELRSVSRLEGVTLFMTMLAGLQAVLHYLTGRDDVVVGTDVAGRNRAEIEPLIGFFINQLVLRTDFSGNPSLRQLLGRVREVALGAYAHQDLPFDKLVEALNPERKLSHSPLFQVKLVFQNAADLSQTLRLNGLSVKSLGGETRKAKFDLLLTLTETAHGLHGSMEYSTDLFNPGTIERIISLFQTTLQNIAAEPDLSLSDLLEVLAETDKHRQLMNERELEHARAQKYQNVRRTALSA